MADGLGGRTLDSTAYCRLLGRSNVCWDISRHVHLVGGSWRYEVRCIRDHPCTTDLGRAGSAPATMVLEATPRCAAARPAARPETTVLYVCAGRCVQTGTPSPPGQPARSCQWVVSRPGIGPGRYHGEPWGWHSRRILVPSGPGLCMLAGRFPARKSFDAVGEMPGTFWIGSSRGIA